MTLFALGAKCSARSTPSAAGAPVMPPPAAAAGAPEKSRGLSSDASAAVPIPAADRPKNWRRVRRSCRSRLRSIDPASDTVGPVARISTEVHYSDDQNLLSTHAVNQSIRESMQSVPSKSGFDQLPGIRIAQNLVNSTVNFPGEVR